MKMDGSTLQRPNALFVLTNNLDAVGAIDQYKSLTLAQKFFDVGSFDLTVPARPYGFVQRDQIIDFGQAGEVAGIIQGLTRTVSSNGDELRIYGSLLDGLLRRRIVVPDDDPAKYGWDVASGTAGDIMAHYVNLHAVTPSQPARAIPNLRIMNGISNIGIETVAKARFDNLADVISELAVYASLGWRIVISGEKLEFQAVEPADRTAQSDNPLILSPSFGNVSLTTAGTDATGYANSVYALGDGEYEDRLYQVYYSGGNTITGWRRSEVVADCGNEDSIERLKELALQKIADLEQTDSIRTSLIPGASNARLGDMCTFMLRSADGVDITYDLVISEMTTTWTGASLRIEVTLGRPPHTLTSQFSRTLRLSNIT